MEKSREEILADINKIIEQEHGKNVTEDSLLTDCDIDSFGYAILWLEVENILDCTDGQRVFKPKYLNAIDYSTYRVSDIIDVLIRFQDENK